MITHKDILERVTGSSDKVVRKICAQLVADEKVVRSRNADKGRRYEFRDEDLQTIVDAVAARQVEIDASAKNEKLKANLPANLPKEPAIEPQLPSDPPVDPPKEPVDDKEKAKGTLLDLVRGAGAKASVRTDRSKASQPPAKESEPSGPTNVLLWVGIGGVLVVIILIATWMTKRRSQSGEKLEVNRPLPSGSVTDSAQVSIGDESLDWMPEAWK